MGKREFQAQLIPPFAIFPTSPIRDRRLSFLDIVRERASILFITPQRRCTVSSFKQC